MSEHKQTTYWPNVRQTEKSADELALDRLVNFYSDFEQVLNETAALRGVLIHAQWYKVEHLGPEIRKEGHDPERVTLPDFEWVKHMAMQTITVHYSRPFLTTKRPPEPSEREQQRQKWERGPNKDKPFEAKPVDVPRLDANEYDVPVELLPLHRQLIRIRNGFDGHSDHGTRGVMVLGETHTLPDGHIQTEDLVLSEDFIPGIDNLCRHFMGRIKQEAQPLYESLHGKPMPAPSRHRHVIFEVTTNQIAMGLGGVTHKSYWDEV